MAKKHSLKFGNVMKRPGFLIPGFLVPGLSLLAVVLFSGFHFTWVRALVLAAYFVLLLVGAYRTELLELKNRERDALACSVSLTDDSRVFCLQGTIAADQREISAGRTKVLNSLEPNRTTRNHSLSIVRFPGPPDTRTADDIRQEISNWERECQDELPARLLNAVVKSSNANVSITVHNNSELPAGDVTVELRFAPNCFIWECGHPSHLSESLPDPPYGLHQRPLLGISAKSFRQYGTLGPSNSHHCVDGELKNSATHSVVKTVESLLAHDMRTIGPIFVGALDDADEVQVEWFAKSSLRSGVIAGQLAIRVFNSSSESITYRVD
jgi:hypothetical protein